MFVLAHEAGMSHDNVYYCIKIYMLNEFIPNIKHIYIYTAYLYTWHIHNRGPWYPIQCLFFMSKPQSSHGQSWIVHLRLYMSFAAYLKVISITVVIIVIFHLYNVIKTRINHPPVITIDGFSKPFPRLASWWFQPLWKI